MLTRGILSGGTRAAGGPARRVGGAAVIEFAARAPIGISILSKIDNFCLIFCR